LLLVNNNPMELWATGLFSSGPYPLLDCKLFHVGSPQNLLIVGFLGGSTASYRQLLRVCSGGLPPGCEGSVCRLDVWSL
jgi:hypothetical protein